MKDKFAKDRIVREAAALLYHGNCRTYKQAKESAAAMLGHSALPSNFEVAIELDRLADEMEGIVERKALNRLLREEALLLMNDLRDFHPRLIGSVWRGTARKGSDVDIVLYTDSPKAVYKAIDGKYKVRKVEYTSRTSEGTTRRYFHIYLSLPSGHESEVIARGIDEMQGKPKCEIFGDKLVGLTMSQLREILKSDPTQKFVPKKANRLQPRKDMGKLNLEGRGSCCR